MLHSIWLGFDPREADGFAVTRNSIRRHLKVPIPVKGLVLDDLRRRGLYSRPTTRVNGRLFDVISDNYMATEFAISRFLVPAIVRQNSRWINSGRWAVFMDSDMLVTRDLQELFEEADPRYAVQVVKHDMGRVDGIKMDGQVQTSYARKNWSSVILFNVDHPANARLTVDYVNETRGLHLHQFAWLDDELIGDLDPKWNYLVGHDSIDHAGDPFGFLSTEIQRKVYGLKDLPGIIHYTEGIPSMAGYEECQFADLWREERDRWAL